MPARPPPILYWLNIVALAAVGGWWVWRYVRLIRSSPRFERREVVYQDWFASGCSQKNLLTKLGGARNCLRLVVTKRFLWVTSWFPFSFVVSFYDMEHVIPLEAVVSVRPAKLLWSETLLLTYREANGDEHTLRLIPKRPDEFMRSLGRKLEDADSWFGDGKGSGEKA